MHATLRRSKTRFDSWRGHCDFGFGIADFGFDLGKAILNSAIRNPKSQISFDAGARRHGNRLQSGFKRVRLPPASLTFQLPVQTTSCNDEERPNQFFVGWSIEFGVRS